MPAYVYLIEEVPLDGESTGPWTKIGYSQNPPQWRMNANLKFGNPREIRVAAAFEYPTNDEAWAAEQSAHKKFADCAHPKEWFRVSWRDVAAWLESQGRQTPRRAVMGHLSAQATTHATTQAAEAPTSAREPNRSMQLTAATGAFRQTGGVRCGRVG